VTPAEDVCTRVVFSVTASGPTRSQVAIKHGRLPDDETAEATKPRWCHRLTSLKAQLETSGA
jgi:hypothetical protein